MNFVDLAAQQERIRDKIDRNIANVLDHGKYIMGPEVSELETKLSQFLTVQHAVACASGTDALLMSLMAYGVGPGDAIFTTPFTFVATADVISLLGATPVFVDVDDRTFNIDPDRLNDAIQALNTKNASIHPLPKVDGNLPLNPKGIIVVDLFGLPADYDAIGSIAKAQDLFLIGDAAQSLGSEYKGRKAAAIPDIACTSFFPAKPLGCYGDGGMCFTNDAVLAEKLKSIRLHGKGNEKYDNVRTGINGRLDTLQAAILLAKADLFPEEITLRRHIADNYSRHLAGQSMVIPHIPERYKSVWAQYSLLAETEQDREAYIQRLNAANIPTAIYYPKPLHLQTAFKHLDYREGDFNISESISKRIFSLPMHPYLEEEDQSNVIQSLKNQF